MLTVKTELLAALAAALEQLLPGAGAEGRFRKPQGGRPRRLRLHRRDAAGHGRSRPTRASWRSAGRPRCRPRPACAAVGRRARDRRPRLHQHPPQARRQASRSWRRCWPHGAGFGQAAGQRPQGAWSSSSRPTRPGRCMWATAARAPWAMRCATCSPPRAGTCTASSTTTTPACRSHTLANSTQCRLRASSPATPSGPSRPTTATTSRTSPTTFLARETVKADDREFTASGDVGRPRRHPPVRGGLPAPRAGPGPAGLRGASSTTTTSSPASTPAAASRQAVSKLIAAGKTYEEDGALWLRSHRLRRRQGPRDAQVRRRLHLLRARRGLPRHQVRARLRQGHQRAGHRPPRHHRARARRPAGGRRRHPPGLPRLRAAHHGARGQGRRGGQDLQARRLLRARCAT